MDIMSRFQSVGLAPQNSQPVSVNQQLSVPNVHFGADDDADTFEHRGLPVGKLDENEKTNEPVLSERFDEALVFARQLHQTQTRKGSNIPYMSHLIRVAGLALEFGATEDEAIAALLHDAIEDQGGDTARQEIIKRFGQNVADIVDGCTDADVQPKPPWHQRKQAYIDHISEAPESVLLVSGCDKLDNLRALLKDYRQLGDELWERFSASKEDSMWYYGELVKAFQNAPAKTERLQPLFDEVGRVYKKLNKMVAASEQ